MRRPSLVLIPILAAAFLSVPALDAASPQELEQIRAALLAERPRNAGPEWPAWQVSDVGCVTDEIFSIDRYEVTAIARECGMEELGFAAEFWHVLFPEGDKGHLGEAVEAAGAVFDVPLNAAKCVARGQAVSLLRRAGSSEAEIERWRKRIDAAGEVVAVVDAVRGLSVELAAQGLSALRTVSGWKAVGDYGTTMAGAGGTIDRLKSAWYSFHANRVARFADRTAEAKTLVGECRLPEAERLLTEVHGDAFDYLLDLRRDVMHYERKVFCDAASADPGLAVPARIAASPFNEARREVLRLEAEVVRAVAAAETAVRGVRAQSAAVSRERDAFLAEVDAVIGRYDAARLACDRTGLIEQRRELERFAAHRCATGAGKGDDIARAIGRIDRAIGAVDEAALPLGTARDDVRSALRACRTQAAREALDRGREHLRNARSSSPIPLQACPEIELWFPEEALVAEIDGRRKALAEAKQKAHALLAQARAASVACRFDEARSLQLSARAELGGCTVGLSDCGSGGTFDADLCSIYRVEEASWKVEDEINVAEARHQEATKVVMDQGQQLQSWGRRALAQARAETPERCVGFTEAREAAQGLEGLADPGGCPDPRVQAFRDEGPRLRAEAEEIEAGLARREADLLATADAAAGSCDAEALRQALGELERLQAVSCGRSRADLAALRRRLAEVEEIAKNARRALAEAEKDLAAWLERCDPSRLATTTARLDGIPPCGWEGLPERERGRVRELRSWGAASAELLRLKAGVDAATLPIQRAATNRAAAEERLAAGDRSEESRQTLASEKRLVAEALAEARAMLDRLAAAPRMSRACLEGPREHLVGNEDALAGLGDLPPSPEGSANAAAGAAPRATGGDPGSGSPTAALVTVPRLRGETEAMAVALLADLGLRAVVSPAGSLTPPGGEGRVDSQTYPEGSQVPARTFVGITVWRGEQTAVAGLTQADCDRDWPGKKLTIDPVTGEKSCKCPERQAWSTVSRRCLALPSVVTDRSTDWGDCRHMPGTFRDPRTGECGCPNGRWDATAGRCVDTAAAAREADVAGRRKAADCENLFSRIRILRGNPDAPSRSMAAQAEREARALGCESGRIAEATGAGSGGGSDRDSPVVPVSGPVEDKHEGEARVTSRNVNVCIIDVNDVLDDHYELYVNGGHVGGVANPEGGATCYGIVLRGGPNDLVLRLVATRGKGTYLKISINDDEFAGSFGGSKNHVWRVVAPWGWRRRRRGRGPARAPRAGRQEVREFRPRSGRLRRPSPPARRRLGPRAPLRVVDLERGEPGARCVPLREPGARRRVGVPRPPNRPAAGDRLARRRPPRSRRRARESARAVSCRSGRGSERVVKESGPDLSAGEDLQVPGGEGGGEDDPRDAPRRQRGRGPMLRRDLGPVDRAVVQPRESGRREEGERRREVDEGLERGPAPEGVGDDREGAGGQDEERAPVGAVADRRLARALRSAEAGGEAGEGPREAVGDGERRREHHGARGERDERRRPRAEVSRVERDDLLRERRRAVVERLARAVHDARAEEDEAEREEDGTEVPDVEVEDGFLHSRRVPRLLPPGESPERVPDRDVERRRHPADEGDEEGDRAGIGEHGGVGEERDAPPGDLREDEERRRDGRERQDEDDDLVEPVQPAVAPDDEERGAEAEEEDGDPERRREPEKRGRPAEERREEGRRDERDDGLDREHRPGRQDGVEDESPAALTAVPLEEARPGGRRVPRPELKRRVLEEVGRQDDDHEAEAEARPCPGALDEVRDADCGAGPEEARAEGLQERPFFSAHGCGFSSRRGLATTLLPPSAGGPRRNLRSRGWKRKDPRRSVEGEGRRNR